MSEQDWKARAEREAAAILNEAAGFHGGYAAYQDVVTLVAIGWLQGANYGTHLTLEHVEDSFDALRAAL